MADGLYLRASGEIACWGHLGDVHVLDRLDRAWLSAPDSDLVEHPKLVGIRKAFTLGRLPFPELCPSCPVLGDGEAPVGRPTRLDKLLIEPSYLCQLDCPACFSAPERHQRGRTPYMLDPELLSAFLDRLTADGIEAVRFIHFEGRGDPMASRDIWALIRIVRQAFPTAEIQMTSHGVYPFDARLFESGLDCLRLSIDGATAPSYERYRRGGHFGRVIDHLRAIRDHRRLHRSTLRVVWKYIVFDWNSSRDELTLARRLADELETELMFVLPEAGTGRPRRLPDAAALASELSEVAPRAAPYDCLDQMGSADTLSREHDSADEAAAHLAAARNALAESKTDETLRCLRAALQIDPGAATESLSTVALLPRSFVQTLLPAVRHPSTLSGLAALAVEAGEWSSAYDLLRRYLGIGPHAVDREAVENLLVRLALRKHLGSENLGLLHRHSPTDLLAAEDAVLLVDPGHRPSSVAIDSNAPVATWVDDILLPASIRTLACLRAARGDIEGGRLLLGALHARHESDLNLQACRLTLPLYGIGIPTLRQRWVRLRSSVRPGPS